MQIRSLINIAIIFFINTGVFAVETALWHDRQGDWTVYRSPNELAVFKTGDVTQQKPLPDGAQLVKAYSNVEIWQVPPQAQKVGKPNNSPNWSAVYFEYPRQAGRRLALPGGVIVGFKPDISHDRIRAWAQGKGYILSGPLIADSRLYQINSPAGQASLILANEIHQDDLTEYASPNWWIEFEMR